MKTLSIVIPVFNEARTIAQVLERVRKASSAGLEKELVVVDDGLHRRHPGVPRRPAGAGHPLRLPRAEPGQGRGPAHRLRSRLG
jgi:cellulose synthase/poly-beta-1,6-N-acetylglucosamine synthase-like glycosyltransferase